jgi:hypothetical protein
MYFSHFPFLSCKWKEGFDIKNQDQDRKGGDRGETNNPRKPLLKHSESSARFPHNDSTRVSFGVRVSRRGEEIIFSGSTPAAEEEEEYDGGS